MGYKINHFVFYGFQMQKYGIPLDLGFSPRESVLLYDAMVHIWPEWTRMQVCAYLHSMAEISRSLAVAVH